VEPPISPLLYALLLFFGMLILLEAGRRLGVRRRPKESERRARQPGYGRGRGFRAVWFDGSVHLFGSCDAVQRETNANRRGG